MYQQFIFLTHRQMLQVFLGIMETTIGDLFLISQFSNSYLEAISYRFIAVSSECRILGPR